MLHSQLKGIFLDIKLVTMICLKIGGTRLTSHICTCTGSFSSTLVSSGKQGDTASCKICCGRPLVDGIGSVSSGMISTVDLELRSFINPDLTWKSVSKRNRSGTRRTRKPFAKIMTMGLGLANKNGRKLENVTVSESEKLGVDVLGQHFSEKVENVPIKKRRFIFRSPSPPPPMTPSPQLETSEKNVDFQTTPDQSCGSSAEQWQQLMKSDCSATSNAPSIDDEKISEVINGVEDFSGIEILAAAACSDSICKESTQERIQSSASSIHLEVSTASLETACCFPKVSVNESKSEGSSFQDNSFIVLHEVPSDKDTTLERSVPLFEFPSCKGSDLLVNESKSEGSSMLHEIPSDKNTPLERFIPLPDDRLLWDLNVPIDAWPCDGGNVYSQNVSVGNIPVRSEELQTTESQEIKTETTNDVVSSDVDGSNRMASDLRSLPTWTDDLGKEKQESGYGSQDIDDDTTNEVVSSEVDGRIRMTSDLRSMPVGTDDLDTNLRSIPAGTDDLCAENKESGYGSLDVDNDTTNEVVSSEVDVGIRMTSDLRSMPVGTDDLDTNLRSIPAGTADLGVEKKESGYGSQDVEDDTTNEVVLSEVDVGIRMTSDLRSLPVGIDDLSAEEQESGYGSQYIKRYATKEVVSSDVDGGNCTTSDSRIMPVGTDDLNTEKQLSEGGSRYDLHLQTKESQDMKNDATNKVVSTDVDGGNRMTSDLRTIPVGTDDCSREKQESEGCSGYDSQFEDGELRESDVQCWEETEQVDYDTEFEEERSFGLEAESVEQELKVDRESNPELAESSKCGETGEALRKNSVSLKSRNVEVSYGETMKFDCLDKSNYDLRVDLSKESKKELLSCVEGSSSSDVLKSRSPEGTRIFNPSAKYADSPKQENPHIHHSPYNFGRPRSKSAFGNREYPVGTDQSPSDAVCVARPDRRITRQFMDSYRPLLRRSPIEREDSYNMHQRMRTVRDTVRDTSPDQNRFRRYPQGFSRGIRDEYLKHVPDDSTQYMNCMLHRFDRRERSISPHGGRPHHAVPYKRARSRSRSRSPIDWLLQRDRNEDSRRRNRPPDFRSDARLDRVRLPFTKRFAADYGEFISPPRSHVSPLRNSRLFEDRNPGLDHFRDRRSHVRMIRQDQRFDQARPIRRLNSDDYYNPIIRPRRFPERAAGGKGCKYEVNDDGKHGSRYATIHRVRCYDTDGGARRFCYNKEDSYVAKNSLTVTNATGVSSRHPNTDAPRTASEDSKWHLEAYAGGLIVSSGAMIHIGGTKLTSRICTCTRSSTSTLVSSSKQKATASCKICCGRPLVDGIGSVSSGMMSTVGLELTSFMDPNLTWKTVSRNRSVMRRTRRPLAKSLSLGMAAADKNARTVEDVTVSESEKVGVDVLGRRFSEKVESVPIKKRRFMFRSPSSPPPLTPYPHLEASEQPVDFKPASDQNFGSSTTKWQQLMKSDCSAKPHVASIDDEKISELINCVEDFSGIEILAAAACSDSICSDVTEYEGNPLVEGPTQERIQSSASSTHLEQTTASLEAACGFPKDSVNESDKDKKLERSDPLPDDKLLWDLNVSMDAWPCDGGTVDTQKDTFPSISARSEELQTTKPQDINNDTSNEVVPSDVDGSNKMTSDLRTMLVVTDDLISEKQESEGCSSYDSHLQTKEHQDIRDDTENTVISSDADGDNRMSSAERTMSVVTDDSSIEKQESEGCSGYDSHLQTNEPQDMKHDTTKEVISSDADVDNRMTSAERIIPVGTDDLSIEKPESKGCSCYDSHFHTNEPQETKHDTTKEVVSSDVDGCNNRLTSDLRTMPDGTDDLSTEKQESEGCSGCDSQLQANEPQDTKHDTAKEVVSSDVDGGNRSTSDSRTMPVGTDDLSTQKQEFEGCFGYDSQLQPKEPQDTKNDTTKEVVTSDVDGGNRLTSESRFMPVGTDDLSTEKQGSERCYGYDSHVQTKEPQVIENDTAIAVVSSDVEGGDRLTSDSRTMPVGTDDLSAEKQGSEGCYGHDLQMQTKEPQVIENYTTIAVVSSDVEGANGLTSGLITIPVGTDDLSTEKLESEGCSGYDSQFEDGELRESDIQCWEEDEQVDYDTEFEEERSFGLEAESGEQELKAERGPNLELTANFKCCETGEALRKNSVSLKIRTVEVSDGETMKIDCLDGSNYDLRVDLSRVSKRELLSCVEGSLSSDVVQRSRFDSFNGSYPRAGRGTGSDKFAGSDRSYSHTRGRSPGGAHIFSPSANYWDSKRCHPPFYDFPDNFGRPRLESVFGNREYPTGTDQIPSEAAGVARPGHRITRQFMGSYRSPVRRRSPIERVDYYSMHPRIPTVRDTSPDRNRFRRYPQGVSRGIRDEYLRHIPDDSTRYMSRMLHPLDRRERSISPHSGRPHHAVPYKRARSRTRSRSPIDWLLQRDRNEDSRRRNRSPDFRSYARMDRVRLPFTKRFGAGYGEFISPPRRRVSPQRNSRMFEDRNPGLDHFRGRKSHVRMQDQRFDQARPIRRLNSNDYFNPMIRPRRSPDRSAGVKGCKYEVSNDSKHGSRYAMIHRERCYDTDGGACRFRYTEEDSYMAKNSLTVTNTTGVSTRCPDDANAPRTASEDR
ncbi:hypothetical protein V6N12_037122 [Hibiscus sabdariffa]|uniref:Uncharacterized protein n=1 Tax=Hibiscus sabdariffa TaxID=183260 RepID=A0ABR2ANI9_9ROSI